VKWQRKATANQVARDLNLLVIDLKIVNYVFNQSLLKNRNSVFSYRTKRQKRRSGEPRVRKATPA
jgi:hypothetical protein